MVVGADKECRLREAAAVRSKIRTLTKAQDALEELYGDIERTIGTLKSLEKDTKPLRKILGEVDILCAQYEGEAEARQRDLEAM